MIDLFFRVYLSTSPKSKKKVGRKTNKEMNPTVTELLCPITLELPIDPVIAEDGMVYERKAVEDQLQLRKKSPMTNLPMGDQLLVAKHVTNIMQSLLESGVNDDRLIAWQKAKKLKELKEMEVQKRREKLKQMDPAQVKQLLLDHIRRCKSDKCLCCMKLKKRATSRRR